MSSFKRRNKPSNGTNEWNELLTNDNGPTRDYSSLGGPATHSAKEKKFVRNKYYGISKVFEFIVIEFDEYRLNMSRSFLFGKISLNEEKSLSTF